MCEYAEGCTITTDPLAKALSQNPRERDADLLVLCPKQYHLLAAVYKLPDSGRMLCQPHFRWGPGPNSGHVHPDIVAVASLDRDQTLYGRCRCGTWNYRPDQITQQLQAQDNDSILPAGELVKVVGADGSISRMGRSWAEQSGFKIVGRAVRSRRLARQNYILGSWVRFTDTPNGADPLGGN